MRLESGCWFILPGTFVAASADVLPLAGQQTTRSRDEAVKKLGQAPSRLLIFQGFHRFGSEPVPFFHSLDVCRQVTAPYERLGIPQILVPGS
jgi:hypothetical protein